MNAITFVIHSSINHIFISEEYSNPQTRLNWNLIVWNKTRRSVEAEVPFTREVCIL